MVDRDFPGSWRRLDGGDGDRSLRPPAKACGLMHPTISTERRGRLAFGVAAGIFATFWIFLVYGVHTRWWLAAVCGIIVGLLATISKTPISIRLLSLAAFIALLFAFDLLGRAVTPR